MNRPIEFRVFDSFNNKMIYPEIIQINTKNGGFSCSDTQGGMLFSNFIDLSEYKKPILMQYVGLKDKNGVKIFEGDIVINNIGDSYYKTIVEDMYCNMIVYAYVDLDHMNNVSKRFEVIGNIYQNHELLEGKHE